MRSLLEQLAAVGGHRTRRPLSLPRASVAGPRLKSGRVDDAEVAFDEHGLVPCIVQDWRTGEVLTLAYMNAESLRLTRETGETHFFSRSRQELWHKGATSGNTQAVKAIRYDCDGDALLALVEPAGPACHTGERTCFHRGELEPGAPYEPCRRSSARSPRAPTSGPTGSYTAALLAEPGAPVRRCRRRPRRSPGRPARSPTSASPRRPLT